MIFEGEYLYDQIIKGKEYINGRSEYEGEYLNDNKYNGKGYDEKGNIIYELINGNGKVKEYDEGFRLLFEGEYLNGKRWNGTEKDSDNDYQYLNGKKLKGKNRKNWKKNI